MLIPIPKIPSHVCGDNPIFHHCIANKKLTNTPKNFVYISAFIRRLYHRLFYRPAMDFLRFVGPARV